MSDSLALSFEERFDPVLAIKAFMAFICCLKESVAILAAARLAAAAILAAAY